MPDNITTDKALDELVTKAVALSKEDSSTVEAAAHQTQAMRELFQEAFVLGTAAAEKTPGAQDTKSELMARAVDALGLTAQASKFLRDSNILTLGDLVERTEFDLYAVPKLRQKYQNEVREMLATHSLVLKPAQPARYLESNDFAEKVKAMPSNLVCEYAGAEEDFIFRHASLCGQVLRTLSATYGLSYRRTLVTVKHYIQVLGIQF